MPDLFGSDPGPDLQMQIREVRRELQQRERVYPRMIDAGKITAKRAAQQQRDMQAALTTLENLAAQARG